MVRGRRRAKSVRKPFKRRRFSGRRALNPRIPRPFRNAMLTPEKLRRTLRFVTTWTVDPAAGGAPTNYSFYSNSLFRPNVAAVDHKYLGFDHMMNLYSNYAVVRCKYALTPVTVPTGGALAVWVEHRLDDIGYGATALSELIEQKKIKVRYINTGDSIVLSRYTIHGYARSYTKNGVNVLDPINVGEQASPPSATTYITVGAQSIAPGIDVLAQRFIITLEADAIFFNNVPIAQT